MTDLSHKVSVVIPNWNGMAWLPDCLQALQQQSCSKFSIVIVDNGSTDQSVAYLREQHPDIQLICFASNRGFAAAVNAGIQAGDSEYVALLNTDTKVQPDWLQELVAKMDDSDPMIGALSSCMVSMDNPQIMDDAGDYLTWHAAAFKWGHNQPVNLFSEVTEIFSPCAGAALYRRSFLEHLNGFDEKFVSYIEDIDLGLRGRLFGYSYYYVPTAVVWHKGHGSELPSGRYVRYMTRNRLLLMKKNIPIRLLFRHGLKLAYGQFYFMLVYKRPLQTLAGWFFLLSCIPHILKERKRLKKQGKLTCEEIENLISENWPEPGLWHHLFKRAEGRS